MDNAEPKTLLQIKLMQCHLIARKAAADASYATLRRGRPDVAAMAAWCVHYDTAYKYEEMVARDVLQSIGYRKETDAVEVAA